MNISEFAQLCGCTKMTISRTFSHPEKVRESTRLRILSLAEEYGYRPNLLAGAMNGNSRLIGILNYPPSIRFFRDINTAIQRTLLSAGYLPILLEIDWGHQLEYLRKLVDLRVDGIIMINIASQLTEQEKREFDVHGIPYVCVDSIPEDHPAGVITDDEMGAKLAFDFLRSHGGTRFAFLANNDYEENAKKSMLNASLRGKYFVRLAEKAGVSVRMLTEQDDLNAIFSAPDYPDAILLQQDKLAPHFLYPACESAGRKIPRDVQVIGYSDIDCTEYLNPKLSTIRQNGILTGKSAAEMILKQIKEPHAVCGITKIPVKLILRKSTISK